MAIEAESPKAKVLAGNSTTWLGGRARIDFHPGQVVCVSWRSFGRRTPGVKHMFVILRDSYTSYSDNLRYSLDFLGSAAQL